LLGKKNPMEKNVKKFHRLLEQGSTHYKKFVKRPAGDGKGNCPMREIKSPSFKKA